MLPMTKPRVPIVIIASLAQYGCGGEDTAADGQDGMLEGTNPGECSDGADNDSDGSYDCDDSDCRGAPDCADSGGDDRPAAPEGQTAGDCSDGADNDADGLFDCDDDGCAGSPDCEDTNAAPGSPAIAIEPAEPAAGDDLSCAVVAEASDPDGDALSYSFSWSVGGTSAGLAEADVSAARTAEGEEWTCTVVASDGELDGAAVGTSVTISSAVSACAQGLTEVPGGDRCIEAVPTPSSWNGAAAECSSRGGVLVRIGSQMENDFIFELYDAVDPGIGFWAGYTDVVAEGIWVWEDGGTTTYDNWRAGEPNNDGSDEHCLGVTNNRDWNDNVCDDVGPGFVCQYEMTVAP